MYPGNSKEYQDEVAARYPSGVVRGQLSPCGEIASDRNGQVGNQCNVLDACITALEKAVYNLENKLSPVLVPAPCCDQSPATPEPTLVPLADGLRNRNRALESLCIRLASLNDRIEL